MTELTDSSASGTFFFFFLRPTLFDKMPSSRAMCRRDGDHCIKLESNCLCPIKKRDAIPFGLWPNPCCHSQLTGWEATPIICMQSKRHTHTRANIWFTLKCPGSLKKNPKQNLSWHRCPPRYMWTCIATRRIIVNNLSSSCVVVFFKEKIPTGKRKKVWCVNHFGDDISQQQTAELRSSFTRLFLSFDSTRWWNRLMLIFLSVGWKTAAIRSQLVTTDSGCYGWEDVMSFLSKEANSRPDQVAKKGGKKSRQAMTHSSWASLLTDDHN